MPFPVSLSLILAGCETLSSSVKRSEGILSKSIKEPSNGRELEGLLAWNRTQELHCKLPGSEPVKFDRNTTSRLIVIPAYFYESKSYRRSRKRFKDNHMNHQKILTEKIAMCLFNADAQTLQVQLIVVVKSRECKIYFKFL